MNQIRMTAAARAQRRARSESRATTPRRPRPPWHGRYDLLVVDRSRCPDCGQQLRTERGADALALFWMHGFGAVVRTTHVTCPCGYRRHWLTETITPRSPK